VLKIRPEQWEKFRNVMTAELPDKILADYRERGLEATREEATGDLLILDKRGKRSRLRFNEHGLPLEWTSAAGSVFHYDHDQRSRLTAVTYPDGQRSEIGYDNADRPVELRRPGRFSYHFGYDGHGRLRSVRHPDGSAHELNYDIHGNVTKSTNRNNAATEYVRDDAGRLRAIVDPLGRRTEFRLNEEGALAAVAFADGTTEQYASHAESGAATLTLRDGTDVVHLLTPEGKLAGTVWPDSLVAIETDDAGNPVAVMTETGSTEFVCDANGNVIAESGEGKTAFEYDPDGRPIALTSDSGRIEYAYDDDGYLAAIVDWDGRRHRIESGYSGQIQEIAYANGMVETRDPDKVGIFSHAVVKDPRGLRISEQKYEWNECERLTTWEDVSPASLRRGATLSYDPEGHVLEERDPVHAGLLARYEYDAAGNLVNDNGVPVAFGAMDQPVRYGAAAVTHDALGQMTSLPGWLGEIRCQFASNGVLRRTECAGRVLTYEYDSLGRRIGKTDGAARWRFGWAGVQLLWEEYQSSPEAKPVRRDYLFFPDGVIPFAFREGGRAYYLQTDTRGAVIRAFDESGAVVWSAVYDAFGKAEILVEKIRQPLRLAGHYFDEETGLHYNCVRYYSPLIKSYLSRDPRWMEPEATNYSYARNDPWNRIDPHGTLAPLVVVGLLAGGAAIGAIAGFAVSKAMGTDPVAGTIGGAIGGLGAFFGPVAGAVSGFFGGVADSLITQYRAGGPMCISCALAEGAMGAVAGALFSGALSVLGKALRPVVGPVVRRIGSAIASKAGAAAKSIVNWVRTQVKPAVRRAYDRLRGVRPKGPKGSHGPPVPRGAADEFGTHVGHSSGRPFFPDEVGIPIKPRSIEGVEITPDGLAEVERHLSRFGPDETNRKMMERLREIAAGNRAPTDADKYFYTHELREFERYKALGWADGVPDDPDAAHRLWNNTHTATLEEYGIKDADLFPDDLGL